MCLCVTACVVRLCILKTWSDFAGYGFNLHADRNSPGLQYIGKVDDNSPAQAAGLRLHDRIVHVNGDAIEGTTSIVSIASIIVIYYYYWYYYCGIVW